MRGNEIIVTSNPRGVFVEGTVDGTPKPGTIMQLQAGTAIDSEGRFTYEVFNQNVDGERPAGPLLVLLPDNLQGKTASDAYVDATRCFLYVPVAGEELNILTKGSGTEDYTVGQKAVIDDSTGVLIGAPAFTADYATPGLDSEAEVIVAVNLLKNAPQTSPFIFLEAKTNLAADTPLHVMYSGY